MESRSREAIVKSLIVCANLFLEMDDSSNDDENEVMWIENKDFGFKAHSASASLAPLSIPRWSGDEYKVNLKLSAETFEFLYQLIGSRLRRVKFGMPMVEAHLQLKLAILKLTSSRTYKDASDIFNLKKSTGYRCTNRVIGALYELASVFVKWPSPAEADQISKSYQEISGLPGIIGEFGQYRFNGQKIVEEDDNSILFQATCDHKQMFTHCHMASPNIQMHEWLNSLLEDSAKFPSNSHLISTSYYPLHENLMVPYEEETEVHKKFNERLESASIISDCFGSFFGRFESLQALSPNEKTSNAHVVACCVLHNICNLKEDKYEAGKVEVEKMRRGSVPCSLKAKLKRDAIAFNMPNG